ncbi:uncharacterized protein DNG_01256 [Cephalotrichum gorgonifer]|uniref:Extracellular membrane protein CFEM domain-containing protein n=1 Tax=Cephalotrichum gorgonifer TaxID=2041049 RepID=A0AAE8MQT2_9PEZI|nr:uncharacterized protein DNG_01256 [Cephalotrichum gorgonifer]
MATKRRLLPSPRTTALLLPLLLITRAHAHKDSGNTVSSDVASLVPACAQECLASFVDGNFPGLDCSKAGSSLECVCGHTGASGFTVGEGAVQCLLAAKSVGICTGHDVDKTVMDQGYSICHGQPNYVRPTHSTIQATLSLDRSSRLLVPAPTLTTTFPPSSPTASAPTIDVPTTTTSPVTASSSTSKISSGRPTETGTTSSPNDAEEAEEARSGPSNGLNTAEIAGLAAGLVTAFAIALLTICLARRRRKKHYPDIETSFFMPREKLKSLSRRFTIRPTGHNISAPLHGSPNRPPAEFPMGQHGPVPGNRPRTFIFPKSAQPTTANVARNLPRRTPTASPVAGLAVTAAAAVPLGANLSEPKRANPSESRPGSQGRPVLSLAIPKDTINPARTRTRKQKPAPKRADPSTKVPVTSPAMRPEIAARNVPVSSPPKPTVRVVEDDSPLTEFEEDGRDSPVQIWRPPSAAPNSAAAALYVADKFGNWVLADERQKKRISLAELEGSSPVISRGAGSAFAAGPSAATAATTARAPNPGGAGLRPPAEIYRQGETRKEMASAASSVYSTDDSAWNPSNAPPIPANPLVPKPLATRQAQRQPGAAGPASRPRYSPVLNPFLDENGVSPVRATFVTPLGPRPRAPGQGSTPRSPARGGAQPPRQFARSSPGQPSPTLGALSKPVAPIYAANYSQRTPRTPQPPPSTYAPAAPPPSTFASAGPSAYQPSPTSSLLAKRLGHEKAASLSLRGSEISSRSGGGGGQLPSTPNWKPLLTPERRGEDLYLSLR